MFIYLFIVTYFFKIYHFCPSSFLCVHSNFYHHLWISQVSSTGSVLSDEHLIEISGKCVWIPRVSRASTDAKQLS